MLDGPDEVPDAKNARGGIVTAAHVYEVRGHDGEASLTSAQRRQLVQIRQLNAEI